MKDIRVKIAAAAMSGLVAIMLLVLNIFGQDSNNNKRAEELFREAENLLRQGKLYEAETKLDQATRLSPENVRYLKAWAEVLKTEGDYQGAIQRLLLVAEIERDDPKPLFDAGILALKSGDRDQAEKIFSNALSRKPSDVPILYQLGYLAMLRSRYDDAARYYLRIVNASFREPEAYRNLGFIYTQKDELEQAEEMYRKAIQYSPSDSELQNDFGNLLALRGKTDEARQAYARALELKPDYHDARANLAALDNPAPGPAAGATASPGTTVAPGLTAAAPMPSPALPAGGSTPSP